MIKKRGIFLGTLLAVTCCIAFLGMTKSSAHYQTQGSAVLPDGSSSKDFRKLHCRFLYCCSKTCNRTGRFTALRRDKQAERCS